MGKGSAPKPPDPKQTSAAQTGTNVGTAVANQMMGMVGQKTPYGSLSYDKTGEYEYKDPYTGKSYDIPTFTANTRLSSDGRALQNKNMDTQQNLADLARSQSGRLNNLLSRPMSLSNLPRGGSLNDKNFDRSDLPDRGQFDKDFSEDRQRVEDTLMQRMQPGLSQDREALQTRLANQGIGIGTEAYDRAIQNADKQTNDARMSAILGAGQEQSRLAGLDLAGAQLSDAQRAAAMQEQTQFANLDLSRAKYRDSQRQMGLQEAFARRNQPLNEIAALMSGAQVQNPSFVNTPTASIPTTDNAALMQNAYTQEAANYRQQQQNAGGVLSGLGGLFGTALSGGLVNVASPLLTIGRQL